ncbi:MAG: YbjN domain-containing protein [Endomicrobium sp.]|jgi:hypothetical protein|nr:YbjN domain-containing protein [Endomicrobium sp.]
MNNIPVFHKSLFASTASKFNIPVWDICWKAYEDKLYHKSIELLFDYINPEFNKKYRSADKKSYKIPHGSIVVSIDIDDENIYVKAPFLNLPEKNAVPLLRQVTEINFNELCLEQIFLRGNSLTFEYSCKLHECNPNKLYFIFKQVCLTGDKYDDKFISQFGATRIKEPLTKPFAPETAETCHKTVANMINEAFEYVKYFESNRYFGLAWSMLACTMRKIDYYAHPQGQFRNELEQAISDMHSDKLNLSEIVTRAKAYLEKLLNTDKKIFVKDLYDIEVFISFKRRSNLKDIQNNFQKSYERIQKSFDGEDYMDVAMETLYCFYNLYYHNDLQDDINEIIVDAMRRSSGKTWSAGAPVLYEALSKIMRGDLTVKKGFFASFFGQ